MIVTGVNRGLRGTARVPGDKSISHRALMHAALSPDVSVLENVLDAGVTRAMVRVLQAVGVSIEQTGTRFVVRGGDLRSPGADLDCGNSGTTMRLLLGVLAGRDGLSATVTGTPGLQRRPMGRVVQPLNAMGANIVGDFAPLRLRGGRLRGIAHRTEVASAQVKAALLLAGLQAEGPTTIHEPGPSRDHSERMLRALGVDVQSSGHSVTLLPPTGPLPPTQLTMPGDISAAAFVIGAAAITPGSEVQIPAVGVNPTRTGLLDVLLEMGADIVLENPRTVGGEPLADVRVRYAPLRGVTVSGATVVRMIDEFPIFAVIASRAEGVTVVREAEELRYKESDRIAALAGELRKLGVAMDEQPDGFRVVGGQRLTGGAVNSHGDHRLAMSLAVAGLVAESAVQVTVAEAMDESFPGFVAVLQGLGADAVFG